MPSSTLDLVQWYFMSIPFVFLCFAFLLAKFRAQSLSVKRVVGPFCSYPRPQRIVRAQTACVPVSCRAAYSASAADATTRDMMAVEDASGALTLPWSSPSHNTPPALDRAFGSPR